MQNVKQAASPTAGPATVLLLALVLTIALAGGIIFLPLVLIPAVLAAGMLAIIALRNPFVAVAAFIVIRILLSIMWDLPIEVANMNVVALASGGIAALGLILVATHFRAHSGHPCLSLLILFFCLMFFNSLRALGFRDMIESLVRQTSPYLMLMLTSAHCDTSRRQKIFIGAILAAACIPLLAGLDQYIQGNLVVGGGLPRLEGAYQNSHNAALSTLLFGIVGTLAAAHLRSSRRHWPLLIFVGLAWAFTVLTQVRTAQIGLFIFLAVYLTLHGRFRTFAGASVLMLAILLTSEMFQSRYIDLIQVFSMESIEGNRDRIGSGRWGIWTWSMQEFLSRPWTDQLLGAGLGMHREMTSPFYTQMGRERAADTHNDYLALLYQMGPGGVVLYLLLVLQVMKRCHLVRLFPRTPWDFHVATMLLALSWVLLLTNSMSNAFVSRVTPAWIYWSLAGLVFARPPPQTPQLKVVPGSFNETKRLSGSVLRR